MVAAVALPVALRKFLRVNTWVSSLIEVLAFCNDSFKVSRFQGARKSTPSGWHKVLPGKTKGSGKSFTRTQTESGRGEYPFLYTGSSEWGNERIPEKNPDEATTSNILLFIRDSEDSAGSASARKGRQKARCRIRERVGNSAIMG